MGRSKRTVIFSLITAAILVAVFALNIVLNYFGTKNLVYLDMTPEGLYTVSDGMEDYCEELFGGEGETAEIKITFCTDPDYLVRSEQMRVTYFMALSLSKTFDNISVECVNVTYNPTAVAKYKSTSRSDITSSDIIVSYGNKYRIATAESFWTKNSEGKLFSYNGEYKLASLFASLTAINSPVAYFVVTDNDTTDYYDPEKPDSPKSVSMASFADMLIARGLSIKTLNLSKVDKIPDDCALLIINNPKEDLSTDPDKYGDYSYVSDAEKIDRFLIDRLGSLIVNKAYDVKLPVLESLLAEWGIAFGDGMVEDDAIRYESPINDGYYLTGVYDKDELSFGSAFYGDYANLSSAPDMLFKNSGYVYCSYGDGEATSEPGAYNAAKTYASFIGTTSDAVSVIPGVGAASDGGFKSLAAVSTRTHMDGFTGDNDFSYVVASNSEYFYSNDILGNTSFANYDILSSLITTVSRTERYAPISLGGISPNSSSFGGKQLVDNELKTYAENVYSPDAKDVIKVNRAFTDSAAIWFTVLVFVLPAAALVTGVAVVLKRKYR